MTTNNQTTQEKATKFVATFYNVSEEIATKYYQDEIEAYTYLLKEEQNA